MSEHLVVFTPSGKRGRFASGASLLEAARALGVDLDSVCGGRGICGRCQCDLAEGEFAKHAIVSRADHLTAPNDVEARYAEKRGVLRQGRRLGCQARLAGDVVVDVPPESQVHRQVVRKRAEARAIATDPAIRLVCVEVAQPDMADPSSDWRRLAAAIEAQTGLAPRADLAVLHELQATLRLGKWTVTAALRRDGRVVALWPGLREAMHGLAVDIGSTTIAAHLCDLATGDVLASVGAMNPQIRFGEDLMSRVSYAMLNEGGAQELTSAVRIALADLTRAACEQVGLATGDVLEMTVVGNPVMHHLFLGLDPVELGGAPFALTIDGAFEACARDLGLDLAPGAVVYALPCIAGHVGADAAGVVLSEAPHLADDTTLVVDVGTNAELVLGDRDKLWACSSPTGPAFEGAQISCGQRAAPGAIERVRIDRATFEPRYKVIGCDLWSDEPGFEDAIAASGVTGVCGSGIIELVAELFLAGVISADGLIDGALAERTSRVEPQGRAFVYLLREGAPRLLLTQTDVRAIQLAKAALYAGAKLLMERAGVDAPKRVVLAGAFGAHIDPLYAMALGLTPDCDPARIASAGNAAGTGARIALLDVSSRAEIEAVVRRIEKVETAIEPRFQELFVDAMAFPHRVDPFPHLAQVVALPARKTGADAPRRRRRS